MSGTDAPEAADRAIRMGASYYFCKPGDSESLQQLLEDIAAEAASDGGDAEQSEVQAIDQFGMLRGSSRGMRKLYRQVRKVAQTEASLMIVGESGTGKELVAHTTHLMSARRNGPYVAFNCAAVPESLLESELFGHEKGAFSGAAQRHRGYFERADGGTLLLDEITEMDVELQAKLLRVLETRTLRRLGSEQLIKLDVRVISACNRSPDEAVREGRMREDLFYRLAQFPVRVPPLRRRGADIPGLAQYFLRELNEKHGTALVLTDGAHQVLEDYEWPGNVRELRHLVERAYIMSESSIDEELAQAIREQGRGMSVAEDMVSVPVGTTIAEMERKLIIATLEQVEYDKAKAADKLGVSIKTLYNRLKSYEEES
ncbi:sigma-54-dependent Fis family transcriptional regulator [Seongchinamella sediminis]|uniref:Sigma-54-dependent Fis family transcriptional regulator n=2 Tax=Seongchinamella sediminis TaxID=2283635 RepID=A0A3L7DSL7_9GAMM|nr:sigma-54-dependent Fis family transcriptional regulator [Seongchinamella sediminis]